jgi:hypothetical protein
MSVSVVEWDRERVIVARGTIDGSRVAFDAIRVVERTIEAPVTNEVLTAIRETIPASSGKSRRKVTLVFPRQSFTSYRIQLPRVPDDEVPDMVKLQASMRLTVPLEQVCLDYAPLPMPADSETRDVMLVTVPKEQVDAAQAALEACDLEVGEIRVSAFCAAIAAVRAGILKEQKDPSIVDALVQLRNDFIEITFARGTSVVFSHSGASWSSTSEVESCVRAELAKARMSAADSLGIHSIGRVVLIGNKAATSAVSDSVTARLDNAVLERIDPVEAFVSTTLPPGVSSAVVLNAAGAVAAKTDKTVEAVDLLNPRRPPEKRDLRRVKTLAGTLVAVVLFAAGFFWRSSNLNAANETLATIRSDINELRSSVEGGKDDVERAAAVREWVARDINWVDQIDSLRDLIISTELIYIRSLDFGVKAGEDLGSIKIDGYAKSRTEVENLGRRLTDAGYKVVALDYEPFGRDGYPIKLAIDVAIPVEPLELPPESDSPDDGDTT